MTMLLLLHPYAGIVHDARLYTLQALSYLHPNLYGDDVFVRFGSQDNYTVFSPLYGLAISLFGVEPAASLLTLAAIGLFLLAAWLTARILMPPTQAAVALLLVLIVPSYYGPSRIFYFLETFVTPRQLAEALTLFGIAAWLSNRRLIALILAFGSMVIHPIIGLAGITFLATIQVVIPHWRRLWPVALAGAALLGLLAAWAPLSRWQFDAEWYQVVMLRSYLGLHNWNSDDWGRVVTVLSTLVVAGLLLDQRLREVSIATLVTTVLLLLVALIGGDLLKIVIVVQAQTWRVLWFSTVVAVLLLPAMYARNWRLSPLARCALLLIAAAWTAHYATPALVTAPLAVVAAAFSSRPVKTSSSRLLLVGCWLAFSVVLLNGLATSLLSWNEGLTQMSSIPALQDKILTLGQTGVLPALVLFAGGALFVTHPSRLTTACIGLTALVTIAAIASPTIHSWTARRYPDSLRESFAAWREQIPAGSEVMWAGDETLGGDGAIHSWLLLERPSFLSNAQAPNALFSRKAAFEMRGRAQALWGHISFSDPFRPKNQRISTPPQPMKLAPLCATSVVRYIVTQDTAIDATAIPAPASAPPSIRDFKLYICE